MAFHPELANELPTPQDDTRPLSPIAQQVAECYAAVYPEAPARTKAMQWLNRARKATSGEAGLKSSDLPQAIDELVAAGVMEPSIEGRKGVAARGPMARLGTITRFCEGAHRRGTYSIILQELDSATYRPYYNRQFSSSHIPEALLEQYARHALISNTFDTFPEGELSADMWFWLTEPRAKPYLERLPELHQRKACIFGLSYQVHYLQPFEVFAKTCDTLYPTGNHQLIVARARIFQGDFTTAHVLIKTIQLRAAEDKQSRLECQSMLALIDMLEGDDAAAMINIEKAIEIERSGTRKRIVYPDTFCFGMSLFSLIRLATPESRSLFNTLLDARVKLKIESDLDWPLMAANSADQPNTRFSANYLPGKLTVVSAIFAIASRWHKDYHHPQDHRGVLMWLEAIARAADASGYRWIAAEAQSVMEANTSTDELRTALIKDLFDDTPASVRHENLGTVSLTQLVTALESWEFSLRELEQLALKAKPAKTAKANTAGGPSRRLVWQLSEIYGGAVEATPLEQSLGKNGQWTGGRRVALKRLREQATTLPHLISQDVKASASIQKLSYGWGGSTTYETDQRTVYQLMGHPCIFDEQGERFDVVECPPMLTLSETDNGLKLNINPIFDGAHYTSHIDQENLRVSVTHFTAAHRRIAEAVPTKGLLIPVAAKERLQSMLDALSSDISVQGDQEIVASSSQQGSAEPLLSMEPSGQSLRVRIRVEPLADSGVFFDAGTGGAVVYVQGPEGTVSVQRDLAEERNRIEAMVLQSSVLAEHYDGRTFFVIDQTVDALELLEDVQDAGVRCIWPSDAPFRIKARADVNQVSLNIKSAKEWFTASGTLPVNDENDDPLTLARLLHLMQTQPQSRFIELDKGEFLSLSKTLKQQLDTLQAFSKTERSDATSNKIHPMALLSLDPLLDNASIRSDKSWKQQRQQIKNAFETTANVPPSLQADLRTYQRDGFAWLERLGQVGAGACLADDMGLGKTVQSLALLLSRAEQGPALVVAPTSVVGNWLAESQRFAPSLNVVSFADSPLNRQEILTELQPFDMIVISYGLLVNNIEHLQQVQWRTMVLDEAQAIKNAATRRAKCVKQLNADFRIVTTGTPVQNNLMDLHSLFSFLNPQLLGSEAAFRKRYALPITRDNDEHAREQLQRLVSPFLLRRHKRDVLKELPARTELSLNVTLSREETALYEHIRQEALDSLQQTDDNNKQKKKADKEGHKENPGQQKIIILSYLTKLRRLCCNPSLITPDWSGPMSKLDVFSDTLSELIASGHKALVFSQFVDHLKIIEKHLKSLGISYQYLDGSTSAKQRTARVNAFQAGEGHVFLISLTAGGTGLNLTAADYVIHMDPWWNPAVEDQASDRAHRIGQKRPVTIVRMVTLGTIEEQIQELHSTKRDLADSVLSGADSPMLDVDMMVNLLKGQIDR